MKRRVESHSQHFLRDRSFIAELVGHSNVRKNDTVIDIGAGSGAITAVLARRVKRVLAYENEPQALELLKKNMRAHPNVEVINADFLRAPLPETPYKVFANIPFHLSSDIVQKLTSSSHPPRAIYLIVQKQFAQKMIMGGAHFHGALGVSIAPWWTARIRRPLRRTDFTPPPAVDTVLLELKPREEFLIDESRCEEFGRFVFESFADPQVYRRNRLPVGKKPSELAIEQWVDCFSRTK